MIYYIFAEGPGEGCDYTIGCNQAFEELEATNMEEAQKAAREWYNDRSSESVESMTIIEVSNAIDCDIDGWLKEARDARAARKKVKDEAEKRATFERLKAKFIDNK